jgi:hypothetical protein
VFQVNQVMVAPEKKAQLVVRLLTMAAVVVVDAMVIIHIFVS